MKRGGNRRAGHAPSPPAHACDASSTERGRAAQVGVLVASEEATVRRELRALLARHGLTVVGESTSGGDAVAVADRHEPDLVLVDAALSAAGDADVIRRLAHRVRGPTDRANRTVLMAIFAIDLVSRVSGPSPRRARERRDETLTSTERVQRVSTSPDVAVLSGREREVLQLLAEGLTSKGIGARLHIALPTVETHRRQIMGKLGLRSIAALTKFAIRAGLTRLGV